MNKDDLDRIDECIWDVMGEEDVDDLDSGKSIDTMDTSRVSRMIIFHEIMGGVMERLAYLEKLVTDANRKNKLIEEKLERVTIFMFFLVIALVATIAAAAIYLPKINLGE